MVRAILDGVKTQTRRVAKPGRCPFGKRGDLLWVREKWRPSQIEGKAWYAATCGDEDHHRWKPSIHMPRRFSRITLDVLDVRRQQLSDITEPDIAAEGIRRGRETWASGAKNPRQAWLIYWNRLNAHRNYSTFENPVVWAVTFARI